MSNIIPDGYLRDARGYLIPESTIRPIDKIRDEVVRELVEKTVELSSQIKKFKQTIFSEIESFISLSAEEYGAAVGGKRGNVSLYSFDGQYKIVRAVQDKISFDERLQAAKSLIDDCINDWVDGARPEIVALVSQAFDTDREGKINVGAVLSLRRLKIEDDRWNSAMTAIGEAIQIVGSKSYVRVYQRVGDTDQYQQIPLDISSV